jgi:hypothetical protein
VDGQQEGIETVHRRGSYQTTLAAMIVLVLGTILFGTLAYVRYSDNEIARRGSPEDPSTVSSSLDTYQRSHQELTRDVVALRRQIEDLKGDLNHVDLELASHRVMYDPATNGWIMGGEGDRSPWLRTRESVNFNLEQLQTYQTALENPPKPLMRPLEDTIRQFQDGLHQVMRGITDADARLEEDRDRLETKLDKLEEARSEENEQFATTKSELATRKSQLEARIRELLELRLTWLSELQPDGAVLERKLGGDYVVIDIGASDRVFNGLRLEVFQYDRGRYVRKGMAEVIDTGANVATCRLVEEVDQRRNPITKGDLVGNPIFDTQQAPVVVLAGEFKRYNKSDLANFLRRSGATVRSELGPGIDYLIAGDRSEPEQDTAREYRVTAMTEEQLINYLHTGFRPKERE